MVQSAVKILKKLPYICHIYLWNNQEIERCYQISSTIPRPKPEKFKLIIHLLLFLTIAFTDNTISILDKDVYIKHNESLVSGYLKNWY